MMLDIGDKVRVIRNESGHKFKIGEVVTVVRFDYDGDAVFTSSVGNGEWFMSDLDYSPPGTPSFEVVSAVIATDDPDVGVVLVNACTQCQQVEAVRFDMCLDCLAAAHGALADRQEYTLQAWTRPDGRAPVPDHPIDQRPTFESERDGIAAYERRVRSGKPEDLVILYKDGQQRPVRHSRRDP